MVHPGQVVEAYAFQLLEGAVDRRLVLSKERRLPDDVRL
jgi:hypothetical protein